MSEPRRANHGYGFRARAGRSRRPGPDFSRPVDAVARALREAGSGGEHPGWAADAADRLLGEFAELPDEVPWARGADVALIDAVAERWAHGWQPVDLWQLARRRGTGAGVEFVSGLIAAEARRRADAAAHPRWRAQLVELGADRPWWEPASPYCAAWAGRAGADTTALLVMVLETVRLLYRAPRLAVLLPPPGSPDLGPAPGGGAGAGPEETGSGVDPKVLARVRALLAKAESTTFAEEADAFFGKAQELMSRYSLERAVVEAGRVSGSGVAGVRTAGRRFWLDGPYLSPKSMLVGVVAEANRCRAVYEGGLGVVTVVGEETDTSIVEVLTTSLLVQAGRAMLAAGSRTDARGQSRTRSFRHTFLVSYAQRIGERLSEAAARAGSRLARESGGELDGRLLPVLAAREEAVARRVSELFPRLITRRVSVSDPAGWTAGRAAADLAVLDVRLAVRS